ncbi:MAG: 4-amino-4-deoxychorismate lyase [Flavobacteriales bacterium]|jgi:branched-chain amino acid aminotransferase|nr:MAG: 4-amino-4-deoxychorismate lyase [Flavobacteriales bacterium]
MKDLVNLNGVLVPGDGPVIPLKNRGFHYGDGLFESMRVVEGRACFTDAHWARMVTGAALLRIGLPKNLDRTAFDRYIDELVKRTGIVNGRCRFTLFRTGDGFYRPTSNEGGFAFELSPLTEPTYTLNTQGLLVDIWPGMRKPVNDLARHKTLNCQLYVMGSLWAQEHGLDDCMLQNDRGNIIESSSGNLFIVSNGVLYTPSLSDGCVGGVMRAQVINLALANGIKVYECSLNPQNLLAADELFFTNAVQGVQWAGVYRTKRYAHRLAGVITGLLVEATRVSSV